MGASIDEPQWDNRPTLNSAHVVTQPERSAKIYADNVGSIPWTKTKTQIWLVVWNHGILNDLPYIGNFIIPTDELIVFRGVGKPPASRLFGNQTTSDRRDAPQRLNRKPPLDHLAGRLNWSPGWTWTDRKPRQSCVQSPAEGHLHKSWQKPGADSGYRAGRRSWRVLPEAIPKPKLLDAFWF